MVISIIFAGALPARGQVETATAQKSARDIASAHLNQGSREPSARGAGRSNDTPILTDQNENDLKKAPKHFLFDQIGIWMGPSRFKLQDAAWFVPLAGATAGLFATDSDVSRHLNTAPDTLKRYRHVSDYGIGLMAGSGAGLYLFGLVDHNEHQRETGFLAGEAAVDSLVVTEAAKYATRRERPFTGPANGGFWKGGDSFPSEHATAAWAIAGVIAHEYPGPIPRIAAYGMATAISTSRIMARQHFPSDVLVGSAIGWLVGEYVYKQHHNTDLDGGGWRFPRFLPEWPPRLQPKFMGSPYVPMDSWVYPAIARLAAMGYVQSDFEGMRPWTRMECARLVQEAQDSVGEFEQENAKDAGQIYDALRKEFTPELALLAGGPNEQVRVESVYSRVTGISGQPLRDGYDFGQTITNDSGRPYAEGVSNMTGISGWASAGPFIGYIRGEYQHAPSSPSLPNSALQALATEQGIPVAPLNTSTPNVNQFDMLDGYAGMQIANWQITFGKQEQWWGPNAGGPMIFSTNAEPVEMLQINQTKPAELPGYLHVLGPIRAQFILGRVGGYHWLFDQNTGYTGSWVQSLADQPFIEGEKLSIKPSENLELGFSATTLFAGAGVPFTTHKLLQAIFSFGNASPGTSSDPGDRRGEFDFTYRIPGVRNWLTVYGDGFTDDEPSPLWGAFDKSAFNAGFYLPRIPKIPRLDFRAEGIFTDNPNSNPVLQHGFFYWNGRYRSGYTNDGNLLASWIGRQGQGAQAWSTYWFTGRDKLQLNFRHQKVSREFVPFGGTVTDGGILADFALRSRFSVTASVQYEKWNFPVISPQRQSDISTSVQFTFWPGLLRVSRSVLSETGGGDASQP